MADTNPYAFPQPVATLDGGIYMACEKHEDFGGMLLRDWFAGMCQADDRLVKVVRAMDDTALELFALHPDVEREDWLTSVDLTDWLAMPDQVAKIARRLELEAKAIARVRFMQADAMLAQRSK
jgi:hypothetical protein